MIAFGKDVRQGPATDKPSGECRRCAVVRGHGTTDLAGALRGTQLGNACEDHDLPATAVRLLKATFAAAAGLPELSGSPATGHDEASDLRTMWSPECDCCRAVPDRCSVAPVLER